MSDLNHVAMENHLPRPDIRQKVTGAARYTVDARPPNSLIAAFIRFPFGSGRVVSADVEAARRVPGVLAVELDRRDGRYAGERLGHIVAESEQALYDAHAALALTCRAGAPTTRPDEAYGGTPDASAADQHRLETLYADAAAVVEATYTTDIQTHSCMEPHAVTADVRGDAAEVWVSTQSLMSCHEQSTRTSGLRASQVTVRAEYVGGGFGSKFGIGPEGTLAIETSKRFQRPCRVALDRRAEHEDGGNRPGSIQYYRIAAARDGRLLGGRMHLVSTVGHSGAGGGVRAPSYYDWGDIVRSEDAIALNAGLPRAFRAPGWPQASFAMESMLDELAARLDIDPVEIRLRNETSERRKRQLARGAERIGWNERRPDGAAPGRIKTGFGCGVASWGNGHGRCAVDLDVYRSGHVEVRIGIQDIGTGATVLPVDVAAWHLGLDRRWFVGKLGVSDYPPGPASGGSVTSRFTAPAVRDAAQKALDQLRAGVAREWSLAPGAVQYENGEFSSGNRRISWPDACAWMPGEKLSVRGEFNDRYWGEGNSDTVQFARVDVDTETGHVFVRKLLCIQACGMPVNRLTTENQIVGGMIQGLSFALFEERRLDGPTGAQLNANLLHYKIAGFGDLPELIAIIDAEPGEDGVRALGEPVTIPTAGAIANAVANAIGARVRALPITPARVLAALDTLEEARA